MIYLEFCRGCGVVQGIEGELENTHCPNCNASLVHPDNRIKGLFEYTNAHVLLQGGTEVEE